MQGGLGSFPLYFLPAAIAAFHLTLRYRSDSAAAVLLIASAVFYAVEALSSLPLLLASIAVNYWISGVILSASPHRTLWQSFGVILNLAPLIFYKYIHATAPADDLLIVAGMPLGLSFYTFQQITCLFDIGKQGVPRLPILRHALFAGFFAQIPAGPISRYRNLAPQIAAIGQSQIPAATLLAGIGLFVIGLAKKILLADNLRFLVDPLHTVVMAGQSLTFTEAWLTSWAFLLQIYFDFSGYSDMAIGIALCCGLSLPVNFNSPLKAASGSGFIDRWHMSLVSWVREYIYQPLFQLVRKLPFGRLNRRRIAAWAVATIVSMTVIGSWHGRQVTMLLNGVAGGTLLVLTQLPSLVRAPRRQAKPGSLEARVRSFGGHLFLLTALLFLGLLMRAGSVQAFVAIVRSMSDWRSFSWLVPHLAERRAAAVSMLLGTIIVFCLPNTMRLFGRLPDSPAWRPSTAWGIAIGALIVLEIMFGGEARGGNFIYAAF